MTVIWIWLIAAGTSGAVAVAAGAAGAHLAAANPQRMLLLGTGAQYALVHAAALLGVAALGRTDRDALLSAAAWLFIGGSAAFSGSLYWLALGGPHLLVWLTPVGGLALILGWTVLALHAARRLIGG